MQPKMHTHSLLQTTNQNLSHFYLISKEDADKIEKSDNKIIKLADQSWQGKSVKQANPETHCINCGKHSKLFADTKHTVDDNACHIDKLDRPKTDNFFSTLNKVNVLPDTARMLVEELQVDQNFKDKSASKYASERLTSYNSSRFHQRDSTKSSTENKKVSPEADKINFKEQTMSTIFSGVIHFDEDRDPVFYDNERKVLTMLANFFPELCKSDYTQIIAFYQLNRFTSSKTSSQVMIDALISGQHQTKSLTVSQFMNKMNKLANGRASGKLTEEPDLQKNNEIIELLIGKKDSPTRAQYNGDPIDANDEMKEHIQNVTSALSQRLYGSELTPRKQLLIKRLVRPDKYDECAKKMKDCGLAFTFAEHFSQNGNLITLITHLVDLGFDHDCKVAMGKYA